MKSFHSGRRALIALALSFVVLQSAQADVRSIPVTQALPKLAAYPYFGLDVAIDGPYILVLAANSSQTYAALLYRRNLSDGKWVYLKTLVAATGNFTRLQVRMKSGIAVVQLGGNVSIFEHVGGDYVPAHIAAPIVQPGGIAISANRLLVGGNGCDVDGLVYEKRSDGVWDISGRLDDDAGACVNDGLNVEINYNYAILRSTNEGVGHAWRRTGPAIDWVPAGTLPASPGSGQTPEPFTLQGATAVANSGYAYLRSGTGTWTLQERATPIDDDIGYGGTFQSVYRDGVLVTLENGFAYPFPRLYLETSPGHFEHVASLTQSYGTYALDVSGRTVVSVAHDSQPPGRWDVEVFTLPAQLRVPAPIVNDFEDGDASDFDVRSGQFQLATRGSNDVFEQGDPVGFAVALATESDWTDYQKVEADFTPTYASGGGDSWAGVVAHYVDSRNYYYAAIRANGTYGVYKRVNGVNTLLRGGSTATTNAHHAALTIDGNQIALDVDNNHFFIATDSTLPHGRGGLATWRARADFDDARVASAGEYGLFEQDYGPYGSEYQVKLETLGGDWQIQYGELGESVSLSQLDKSGDARAYIGVPVANQEITAIMRVDSFGTSAQGTWFGLLARYVDPQNHYYVTVRSTGQIQIRKIVNGVITVLSSANFTAVPGRYYEFRLRVIDDQLQLYVDRALVVSAHDGDIERGRYGMATYRTAASWETFWVNQP